MSKKSISFQFIVITNVLRQICRNFGYLQGSMECIAIATREIDIKDNFYNFLSDKFGIHTLLTPMLDKVISDLCIFFHNNYKRKTMCMGQVLKQIIKLNDDPRLKELKKEVDTLLRKYPGIKNIRNTWISHKDLKGKIGKAPREDLKKAIYKAVHVHNTTSDILGIKRIDFQSIFDKNSEYGRNAMLALIRGSSLLR